MTFLYLAGMAREVPHMATRNVWFMESQAAGSLTRRKQADLCAICPPKAFALQIEELMSWKDMSQDFNQMKPTIS